MSDGYSYHAVCGNCGYPMSASTERALLAMIQEHIAQAHPAEELELVDCGEDSQEAHRRAEADLLSVDAEDS